MKQLGKINHGAQQNLILEVKLFDSFAINNYHGAVVNSIEPSFPGIQPKIGSSFIISGILFFEAADYTYILYHAVAMGFHNPDVHNLFRPRAAANIFSALEGRKTKLAELSRVAYKKSQY